MESGSIPKNKSVSTSTASNSVSGDNWMANRHKIAQEKLVKSGSAASLSMLAHKQNSFGSSKHNSFNDINSALKTRQKLALQPRSLPQKDLKKKEAPPSPSGGRNKNKKSNVAVTATDKKPLIPPSGNSSQRDTNNVSQKKGKGAESESIRKGNLRARSGSQNSAASSNVNSTSSKQQNKGKITRNNREKKKTATTKGELLPNGTVRLSKHNKKKKNGGDKKDNSNSDNRIENDTSNHGSGPTPKSEPTGATPADNKKKPTRGNNNKNNDKRKDSKKSQPNHKPKGRVSGKGGRDDLINQKKKDNSGDSRNYYLVVE